LRKTDTPFSYCHKTGFIYCQTLNCHLKYQQKQLKSSQVTKSTTYDEKSVFYTEKTKKTSTA